MKERLTALALDFRRVIASYVRAAAGLIGATQGLNAFDARGWAGVITSLGVALVPAGIQSLTILASAVDPDDDNDAG